MITIAKALLLEQLDLLGVGSPAVILESGLGSDMTSQDKVFDPISTFTRVCRYNRRGYGLSSSHGLKRTIENQNRELKKLLDATGVQWPKIRDFFFPDPFLANRKPGFPEQNMLSSLYIEALTQDNDLYVDLLQADKIDLGDLPIVIISRGKDFMNQGFAKSEFDLAWDGWQKRLLNLSIHSQQIIAQDSGHMIPFSEPELIIEAIQTLQTHPL